MIGLFALSMVALVWTKANAGCTTNPRLCATWIKGSEICQVRITDGMETGDVTCEAFGTEGVSCNQNSTCSMIGTLVCGPAPIDSLTASTASDDCRHSGGGKGHDKGKGKGHEGDCQVIENFTLTPAQAGGFPLFTSGSPQCDENGNCRFTGEVDPGTCVGCCTDPDFPVFVTFTADEFNAVVRYTEGEEDFRELNELCQGQGHRYQCDSLPPPVD
jgi:hypothetical protein